MYLECLRENIKPSVLGCRLTTRKFPWAGSHRTFRVEEQCANVFAHIFVPISRLFYRYMNVCCWRSRQDSVRRAADGVAAAQRARAAQAHPVRAQLAQEQCARPGTLPLLHLETPLQPTCNYYRQL